MSRKLAIPDDQKILGIYGMKILIVCCHPAMFGGHGYYGSGDVRYLIFCVTFSLYIPTLPSLKAIDILVVIKNDFSLLGDFARPRNYVVM